MNLCVSADKSVLTVQVAFLDVEHLLRTEGKVDSHEFECGGHTWKMQIENRIATSGPIPLYLGVVLCSDTSCHAHFSYDFLNIGKAKVIHEYHSNIACAFSSKSPRWGMKFLERATIVQNGSVFVNVTLTVHGNVSRTCFPAENLISDDAHTMQTDISKLYNDRSQAEVEIIASDGTIERAHPLILTMRSEVFKTMFAVAMSEVSTLCVHMRTTPTSIVKSFVKFLYMGGIGAISFATASELYALSHQYQMKGLNAQCSQRMEYLMDSDTVIAVLSTGDLYDDQPLRKIALSYIQHHASALLHDCAFSEHLLKYIADRYVALESKTQHTYATLTTKSWSNAKAQVQQLLQAVAGTAVIDDVATRIRTWVDSLVKSFVQFLYSIEA